MAISSVNYNLNSSYGAYVQRLSEATKRLLIELGIPFNDRTTEAEAKKLIENARSKKTSQGKNDSNLTDFQNKPQDDLLERAKKLADKIGVSYGKEVTLSQLLTLIETHLEDKINNNKNNISVLNELKSYSNELASLQAESSGSTGFDNNNQALMMSLELLSQYNRNMLYR